MTYPFGKDISYTFYPLDKDGSTIASIPAQTATLYVFTTKPSPAAALAGTGALSSTTTSWTLNATSGTFTISAIADPDQNSTTTSYRYWVSVVLILKTAGTSQAIIRSLDLERVGGQNKAVSVVSADLTDIYPAATTYATSGQITSHISAATDILKAKLKSKGYEWALIHRLDRMNNVVRFMVLANIMRSQIQDTNDHFAALYADFSEQAETLLGALKFEYDEYDIGEPTTDDTQQTFGIVIR